MMIPSIRRREQLEPFASDRHEFRDAGQISIGIGDLAVVESAAMALSISAQCLCQSWIRRQMKVWRRSGEFPLEDSSGALIVGNGA